MNLRLDGRQALVCGGSAGIGLACALTLAELGAQVSLVARDGERLRDALAQLPALPEGRSHRGIEADASDPQAFVAAISAAGPMSYDILINNSGGPPAGSALAAASADFLAAFNQQLLSAHQLVQQIVPGMRERRWGRIINIVSTSVREPIANLGVSNTIRGAVAAWAKTLSRELGAAGITVNNVLPGYTRTQRLQQIVDDRVRNSGRSAAEVEAGMLASVPLARFAEPAEVAAAVAFLASPAAAYISGVSLPVDGGRMQSI